MPGIRQPWTPDRWVRVFLTRVDKQPNGCWLWIGQSIGRPGMAYGHVRKDRRMQYAHRAYYEYDRGPVPDGMDLDHLCRVRLCVNPDHLEPVTRQENVRRGLLAQHRPTCVHGHVLDEANTYVWSGRRSCRACRAERSAAHNIVRRAARRAASLERRAA